ncbi:DUF397 domain-containing protein [Streptomyces sparsus]
MAPGTPDTVPVRDSKNPHGPTLTLTTAAYTHFLNALKTDQL